MPSPLNIPQKYTTDDALRLKQELERMAREVDKYLRGLQFSTVQVPQLSQINPSSLAFGQMARVNVPDGYVLSMQLPRADPANIGRRCGVLRGAVTGEVLIYAPDCLVGGAPRYRMANDLHFVEFLFEGDYYPSRAGAGV